MFLSICFSPKVSVVKRYLFLSICFYPSAVCFSPNANPSAVCFYPYVSLPVLCVSIPVLYVSIRMFLSRCCMFLSQCCMFFSHQSSGNEAVWLVAPLISRLPVDVQGRVLSSAGLVLENSNKLWYQAGSDEEKERR